MKELLCIVSSVMMLFSLQPVSAHRSYGKETIAATDTVMVSDEFRYVGQWPSGHGVLYHEYEGLYIGEFVNARPHGIIRHYSPYGHRYYGEYSEGKKHGHGQYFKKDGEIITGDFVQGLAEGKDTVFFADGGFFLGICQEGAPTFQGFRYDFIPQTYLDRKPVFPEIPLTEEQERFMEKLFMLAAKDTSPKFGKRDANAFAKWVTSNLVYPEGARKSGIEGTVLLKFTVNEDGQVEDVKVLESVSWDIDKEAVRVVSSSPKWTPGTKMGRPYKYTYTHPVIFMLRSKR